MGSYLSAENTSEEIAENSESEEEQNESIFETSSLIKSSISVSELEISKHLQISSRYHCKNDCKFNTEN